MVLTWPGACHWGFLRGTLALVSKSWVTVGKEKKEFQCVDVGVYGRVMLKEQHLR